MCRPSRGKVQASMERRSRCPSRATVLDQQQRSRRPRRGNRGPEHAIGHERPTALRDRYEYEVVVYRIDPSNPKGMIKLEAARQYQWDLKLSEYNNLPPDVAAIESTVKSLGPQSSR